MYRRVPNSDGPCAVWAHMPNSRLPSMARRIIKRYRGSNTCSGQGTPGRACSEHPNAHTYHRAHEDGHVGIVLALSILALLQLRAEQLLHGLGHHSRGGKSAGGQELDLAGLVAPATRQPAGCGTWGRRVCGPGRAQGTAGRRCGRICDSERRDGGTHGVVTGFHSTLRHRRHSSSWCRAEMSAGAPGPGPRGVEATSESVREICAAEGGQAPANLLAGGRDRLWGNGAHGLQQQRLGCSTVPGRQQRIGSRSWDEPRGQQEPGSQQQRRGQARGQRQGRQHRRLLLIHQNCSNLRRSRRIPGCRARRLRHEEVGAAGGQGADQPLQRVYPRQRASRVARCKTCLGLLIQRLSFPHGRKRGGSSGSNNVGVGRLALRIEAGRAQWYGVSLGTGRANDSPA